MDGFIRTVVHREVVDGAIHRLPGPQLGQMLDQEIGVKGIGMVIVEPAELLIGHALMRLVIVVMVDHADIVAKNVF